MTLEGLVLAVAALAVVVLMLLVALVLLYGRYAEAVVVIEQIHKGMRNVVDVIKEVRIDYASVYMPCGKEKLSPVETMLLLTEYMGVEFYGGDGGPSYVSTEHDEVMKKAHKEASRASFKG